MMRGTAMRRPTGVILVAVLVGLMPALPAPLAAQAVELPRGFDRFAFGTSLSAVQDILSTHPLFRYRGQPDVGFALSDRRPIIQTQGTDFIETAVFHFRDDALYLVSMQMNRRRIDFAGFFGHFVGRYGEPQYLDPTTVVWQSQTARIVLERPLTVKYIDRTVFDGLADDNRALQSIETATRLEFLDRF